MKCIALYKVEKNVEDYNFSYFRTTIVVCSLDKQKFYEVYYTRYDCNDNHTETTKQIAPILENNIIQQDLNPFLEVNIDLSDFRIVDILRCPYKSSNPTDPDISRASSEDDYKLLFKKWKQERGTKVYLPKSHSTAPKSGGSSIDTSSIDTR